MAGVRSLTPAVPLLTWQPLTFDPTDSIMWCFEVTGDDFTAFHGAALDEEDECGIAQVTT